VHAGYNRGYRHTFRISNNLLLFRGNTDYVNMPNCSYVHAYIACIIAYSSLFFTEILQPMFQHIFTNLVVWQLGLYVC